MIVTVGAADVLVGAALGPEARDDLDDQVDVVRKQRVEVDERHRVELPEADIGGQPGVVCEPTAVLGEEKAERVLRAGVLRQDALARNFGDVRGLEVDLEREAVHEASQLDTLVIEASDQLGEFLLRRDDQPHLPAADPAETLHDCLEIKHLLDVAGHELADLIDHEDQTPPAAPPRHELLAPLGEERRGDVGPTVRRLAPAIGRRVGRRVQRMHDAAGMLNRDGDLALLDVPVLVEHLVVRLLEFVEPILAVKRDLQFRQVEVTGVAQALQEEPVHDLRDRLVAGTDAAVRGHIEDHGVGRDMLGDVLEQYLDPGVARASGEQIRGAIAQDAAVLEGQPQVFRETRLAGAEEAGDPDTNALVRFVGRLAVLLEDVDEVFTERVSDHVFGKLLPEDLLAGLIDLDDLLDATVDVAGEELLHGLVRHLVRPPSL